MSATRTTRTLRDTRVLAESEGLRVIDVISRRRHFEMLVENDFGQRLSAIVPQGTNAMRGCAMQNVRSGFKRFARGEAHGLKVLA